MRSLPVHRLEHLILYRSLFYTSQVRTANVLWHLLCRESFRGSVLIKQIFQYLSLLLSFIILVYTSNLPQDVNTLRILSFSVLLSIMRLIQYPWPNNRDYPPIATLDWCPRKHIIINTFFTSNDILVICWSKVTTRTINVFNTTVLFENFSVSMKLQLALLSQCCRFSAFDAKHVILTSDTSALPAALLRLVVSNKH